MRGARFSEPAREKRKSAKPLKSMVGSRGHDPRTFSV